MSVAKVVKNHILSVNTGKPFTTASLLGLGRRKAVDCALVRLVGEGTVVRVSRGIYMRPKSTRFVKSVPASLPTVLKALAERSGEQVAMSGAEAAQRLKLTTQVPVAPLYYTSGSTRELTINNQRVKLKHVANRKLALAGTPAGMALSALWFLGRELVNNRMLTKVANALSPEVLEEVKASNVPGWMTSAINAWQEASAT